MAQQRSAPILQYPLGWNDWLRGLGHMVRGLSRDQDTERDALYGAPHA
jgi:hypothetical protein